MQTTTRTALHVNYLDGTVATLHFDSIAAATVWMSRRADIREARLECVDVIPHPANRPESRHP